MRPYRLALLFVLLLPSALAAEQPVKTLEGKVVAIADGDTLTVLDADKEQPSVGVSQAPA